MKTIKAALLGIFCMGVGGVVAAPSVEELKAVLSDKKKLEAAIASGQRQAAFCFSCHGEHGVSLQPEVPNLAAQPASYLLEQIRRFGDGRRRDAFMQGLLKMLPDQEKLNIALYFAAQKSPTGTPLAGADAAAGKSLYDQRCVSCHGSQGRGNDVMPTVAGQKTTYLVNALRDYRDRNGDRQHREMSESLAAVSDADLANLASHMSLLR